MHSRGDTNQHSTQVERADEPQKRLSRGWWMVLMAVGFFTWTWVGAQGLAPRWLWVGTLLILFLIALAIALFVPKRVGN